MKLNENEMMSALVSILSLTHQTRGWLTTKLRLNEVKVFAIRVASVRRPSSQGRLNFVVAHGPGEVMALATMLEFSEESGSRVTEIRLAEQWEVKRFLARV